MTVPCRSVHVAVSRDGTHVTVPRVGASRARTLVLPCVLTPHLPPWAIAHLTPTHFPSSPYSLVFLSLLTFPHSPDALAIPLSFLHRPSPSLTTFLSMACVLKRFLLTSPRKLSLTCVKWGFLRTAEPHRTSQLSPYAPLMSQCHVYVMPGREVPCPTPSPRCHHTFAPLPCTCTRLSLSQVFDHYQHFANSVVEVYISFKKNLLSLKT